MGVKISVTLSGVSRTAQNIVVTRHYLKGRARCSRVNRHLPTWLRPLNGLGIRTHARLKYQRSTILEATAR